MCPGSGGPSQKTPNPTWLLPQGHSSEAIDVEGGRIISRFRSHIPDKNGAVGLIPPSTVRTRILFWTDRRGAKRRLIMILSIIFHPAPPGLSTENMICIFFAIAARRSPLSPWGVIHAIMVITCEVPWG